MPLRSAFKRLSIKRWMPSTLFARALLILVVPVILLQLLVAHIFYDRHWTSVVRNMSSATAADIAMLLREYEALSLKLGTREARIQTTDRGQLINVIVTYSENQALQFKTDSGRRYFPSFFDDLNEKIHQPIQLKPIGDDTIRVRVNAHRGVMDFSFPRKRLASSTTAIFIAWMVGSSLLLTTIAILFLRNQIRPIVALAGAAEQFGLGQEVISFSPRGASEVRRAGRAFVVMAERTRRYLQNRTEMLAGISHDLRTPLTRMKLELEMGKMDDATRDALGSEIDEMRMMIDEYLDFARGDAGEAMELIDICALAEDVVSGYRRSKQDVTFAPSTPALLMVRPQAIRRTLINLIDNALRYGGGTAEVCIEVSQGFVRLKVLDQGTGIAEAEQEEVFKPFTRLEPSRNLATGGVGLGLSIARSVAQSHGGDIVLENKRRSDGSVSGLEVTLRLPRELRTASQPSASEKMDR